MRMVLALKNHKGWYATKQKQKKNKNKLNNSEKKWVFLCDLNHSWPYDLKVAFGIYF